MGTIQIDGSTPKLTIGNATAEDATILFDGNAQDFYIALDDSADDLLIGLGSTVGTTPIIAIDENKLSTFSGAITVGVDDTGHDVKFFGATASAYMLWDESADDLILAGAAGLSVAGATATAALTASGIVKTDDTTEATSTTDGSLQTDGGLSVAKDTVLGDDLKLLSDSSVIAFGADGDTTLTHTDGTGLTLNSTNKICFNDASQFIQGSSATVISIGATDEIDLTATAVDLNGTLNVSGVATFQATPVFPDGSLALADLDIDGGTDIGAAIVDADLFIIDDGAGGTNRKVAASRIKTYAGGGLALLETDAVSNASEAELTEFSSTYKGFMILISNVVGANDDVEFYARIDRVGVSGYDDGSTDYSFAIRDIYTDGNGSGGGSNTNQSDSQNSLMQLSPAACGNATGEGYSAIMTMGDVAGSDSVDPLIRLSGAYVDSAGHLNRVSGAVARNDGTAVEKIKFYMGSGNITGTFKLYGYT